MLCVPMLTICLKITLQSRRLSAHPCKAIVTNGAHRKTLRRGASAPGSPSILFRRFLIAQQVEKFNRDQSSGPQGF